VTGCAAGNELVDELVGLGGMFGLLELFAGCGPVDLLAIESAPFKQLQDLLANVWELVRRLGWSGHGRECEGCCQGCGGSNYC